MLTRLQKRGNGLGLRIPKPFAAEAQVEAGSTVDISIEEGGLVVRPVRRPRYSSPELLNKVPSRNLHVELATGEAVGREAW